MIIRARLIASCTRHQRRLSFTDLPEIHENLSNQLQNPGGMATSSMEQARRRLLEKAKKKSLMITVVIVAAFVVCWTPYYGMMFIFIFNLDPEQKITGDLQSAIFFFGESTPPSPEEEFFKVADIETLSKMRRLWSFWGAVGNYLLESQVQSQRGATSRQRSVADPSH